MTGRALYDKYTDAHATIFRGWVTGLGYVPSGALLAWPFLSKKERDAWNETAKRITPRKR